MRVVPLLLRPPGGAETQAAVDELVLNIDVAPTLLDLCACPIPPSMQGTSFAAQLRGDGLPHPWRDGFYYEHVSVGQRPQIARRLRLNERAERVEHEGRFSCEHLVAEAAEGVDIRAMINGG